jgi:hypothetical protein
VEAELGLVAPHDLRRWASTNANAVVGNPFRVEQYLDHEIGGVAGTYNLNQYVEQKTYVAYTIENKVREAIGMKKAWCQIIVE